MRKIILVVIDGLGDRPIKELGGKTPLEAAGTPNLDWLAEKGVCGTMTPAYTGAIPTSEEGHFSLFGYNPRVYGIRRGIFTAQGVGIKLRKGDVALRGNFGTIDESFNIIDRRAQRITNTGPLIRVLTGIVIDKVKFLVKNAGGHRIAVILRGRNLSCNISDGDPHYAYLGKRIKKIVPLDGTPEAKFTADVLNKFLKKAYQRLKNHPLNKRRQKKGFLPANYLLVRGASSVKKIPPFKKKYKIKACCIAGKILYQQIGRSLGMDLIKVKGANGLPTTNLKGKIQAAEEALKKYDFVFLHIKAADSLAEDGDFKAKRKFIEKIDWNLKQFLRLKKILITVTADHSTCCKLKRHCVAPIPFLVYREGMKGDSIAEFSEKACKKGGLGKIKQIQFMEMIMRLAQT